MPVCTGPTAAPAEYLPSRSSVLTVNTLLTDSLSSHGTILDERKYMDVRSMYLAHGSPQYGITSAVKRAVDR